MRPVDEITDEHMAYWSQFPDRRRANFLAPQDMDDCDACPTIVTTSVDDRGQTTPVVRVPFTLDDEDREAIAGGGTIWLSTWGGLPPHTLEVADAPRPLVDARAEEIALLKMERDGALALLGPHAIEVINRAERVEELERTIAMASAVVTSLVYQAREDLGDDATDDDHDRLTHIELCVGMALLGKTDPEVLGVPAHLVERVLAATGDIPPEYPGGES